MVIVEEGAEPPMPATPLDEDTTEEISVDTAAATKIPEVVGLGITNGLATPDKELPPAPLSSRDSMATPPPKITVNTEAINGTPPPPPPPKPERSPSRGKPQPLSRTGTPAQARTKESMQDVELSLSRAGTPVERASGRASDGPRRPSNPASTSVSSLHSITSSVQSPSRPMSTRPRMPMNHSRQSSTATTLSLTSQNPSAPGPQLSSVLITPPLQVLVNSKEARKSPSFAAAAQRALDLCQAGEGPSNSAYLHPREIFEPLRLAISNPQTTSVPILITSLDLLSKLISHSFFSEPDGPPRGMSPLPDLITHTISLSYSETSPPQVALQVVKALMAIVLSTDKGMLVHQSSLLKAVRTVYNVFLLSNDAANQVVAQGGLTQMAHHVFSRVVRPEVQPASVSGRQNSVGENEARRAAAERAASEEAESHEDHSENGFNVEGDAAPEPPQPNGTETEKKMTL